ncbi:MAG: Bpu10I family restriction endonuclease [candidate division WOR-3 bacterium]
MINSKFELEAIEFLSKLPKACVHGRNILTKLKNKKITQPLFEKYKTWFSENEKIIGFKGVDIKKRVQLLNEYKNYTSTIKIFTSQSQFHSTVIEEFLYYLFRDKVASFNFNKIELGGIRAYSNLYFSPKSLREFQNEAFIRVNEKDQDFAIYRQLELVAENTKKIINIPIVSIECKTYLDKTMLEGSIATAEKIKLGNPYCLFLIVTETYSVSLEVDPKYSRIDQIYVLRKDNPSNPIQPDVVIDLFTFVANHLAADWSDIATKIRKNGKVL